MHTSSAPSDGRGAHGLREQQRIVEILDARDARIRAEEAYRDKLKLQKKVLMEDLLTGRIRVSTAQENGA